jgi:hypothetical protein
MIMKRRAQCERVRIERVRRPEAFSERFESLADAEFPVYERAIDVKGEQAEGAESRASLGRHDGVCIIKIGDGARWSPWIQRNRFGETPDI